MNKLLEEEYFHIGTDKILKELWINIQMEQIHNSCLIPYGGLFTSHQNKYTLSDWLSYKMDCNNNDVLNYMYSLKSILIKYKCDTKLLTINTENDYRNLKDSGFVKTLDKPIIVYKYLSPEIYKEVIDYEKVSEHYDLLYINPYAHKNLNPFSIRTMYALNPNCIDYFKQLKVDYENCKILSTSNKMYIEEPSNEYYKLVDYIRSLFPDIESVSYNEYIAKLNIVKNNIEFDLSSTNYSSIPYRNNICISNIVNVIIRNVFRENYLKEQKRLLKK